MEKRNWLYGMVILLLLALIIETGFLISKTNADSKTRASRSELVSPSVTSTPRMATLTPSHFSAHWDPMEEIRQMQEEMNRLFDQNFGRFSRTHDFSSFSPDIDIQETESAYIAKADLPGLEKDKIQIRVTGNLLTLEGERRVESEKQDPHQGFYAAERSYGSFARSLSLPGPVDEAGVKADYQNGVLTVTLPKLKTGRSGGKLIEIA